MILTMVNKKIYFVLMLFLINGCIYGKYYGVGVFDRPVDYVYPKFPGNPDNINEPKIAYVNIGENQELIFDYLGYCGGSVGYIGFIIPIVPFFEFNKCEQKGFNVGNQEFKNISFQLKYNNKIYEPRYNEKNIFNIENFNEFKKAKDKTLIIHKKEDDGTIITKEMPFKWKIVNQNVVLP